MAGENIREWGRANGFDVGESGRLPEGLRQAFDSRHETPVDGGSTTPEVTERPPAIVKPSTIDRVKGMAARGKPAKTVSRARTRVSVEKVVSWAWASAASVVMNLNPAVGRVLEIQAPVAGMILEDKIKNTIVDRALQPLARGMDGGSTAVALVGPPLLVQALSMQPQRAPQIIPLLRQSLRTWVAVAGDKLEKQQAENDEFEEKYGKRVDEMLEHILAPFVAPGE